VVAVFFEFLEGSNKSIIEWNTWMGYIDYCNDYKWFY